MKNLFKLLLTSNKPVIILSLIIIFSAVAYGQTNYRTQLLNDLKSYNEELVQQKKIFDGSGRLITEKKVKVDSYTQDMMMIDTKLKKVQSEIDSLSQTQQQATQSADDLRLKLKLTQKHLESYDSSEGFKLEQQSAIKETVVTEKLEDGTDLNKLAKAVAWHETHDCGYDYGSSKVNNCFGVKGKNGFRRYATKEESYEDFKRIWAKSYKTFPKMAHAIAYSGNDRAHTWLANVSSKYYSL